MLMRFLAVFLVLMTVPALAAAPASRAPGKAAYAQEVCGLLQTHADSNNLPVTFFTRLIWKESLFDANALSPAGAEGIAQFMPGTAALRGLKDSFDHREALSASATYLADLRDRFGNLGLAAAAYNFGEDGTSRWLARRTGLPAETEDYVLAITGHEADAWRDPSARLDIPGIGGKGPFAEDCQKLVLREMAPPSPKLHRAPQKPWGVVVAGNFSEARALKAFARAKMHHAALLGDELPMVTRKLDRSRGRRRLVRILIGRNTRQEAQELCARLRQQGGSCLVARP
jgi:hypothetical protein